MNLSKRTWHYKLHRYFWTFYDHGPVVPFTNGPRVDHQPKSLCSYFWSTVFMASFAPLALALLLVAWPIAVIYEHAFVPIKEHRAEKREAKGLPPKGESLILSYAKAKKQKVCPTITLTD